MIYEQINSMFVTMIFFFFFIFFFVMIEFTFTNIYFVWWELIKFMQTDRLVWCFRQQEISVVLQIVEWHIIWENICTYVLCIKYIYEGIIFQFDNLFEIIHICVWWNVNLFGNVWLIIFIFSDGAWVKFESARRIINVWYQLW